MSQEFGNFAPDFIWEKYSRYEELKKVITEAPPEVQKLMRQAFDAAVLLTYTHYEAMLTAWQQKPEVTEDGQESTTTEGPPTSQAETEQGRPESDS